MNVILSIKPKYVEAIIKGEKIYEFRKSIFKKVKNRTIVYIYSSSPIKKIVGRFLVEIDNILCDSPKNVWEGVKEFAGITQEEFFNYFRNKIVAYAIKVENLELFWEPIKPKEYIPNFKPPQSFCYISAHTFGD